MNSDEIGNIVRQVLTALLSSGSVAAVVNHDQATAIAAGVAALASVAWSVYAHRGMRKVPEKAIVVGEAPTVAQAKAKSIP